MGENGRRTLAVLAFIVLVAAVAWAATYRMPGSIDVTGDITGGDDLILTDDATIGGNISVTGTSALTGNVTASAELDAQRIEVDTLKITTFVAFQGNLPDTGDVSPGVFAISEGGTLFVLFGGEGHGAAKTWAQVTDRAQ